MFFRKTTNSAKRGGPKGQEANKNAQANVMVMEAKGQHLWDDSEKGLASHVSKPHLKKAKFYGEKTPLLCVLLSQSALKP